MSLLSKDRTSQITLLDDQYYWMYSVNNNIEKKEFHDEDQLIRCMKEEKQVAQNVDITISNHLCRFAMLPALKVWPEQSVLNYLIVQQLQMQYPDFDPQYYVLLHDRLKFNESLVIVALPNNIWKIINNIAQFCNVKSIFPSILRIWNLYESSLNASTLLIVEEKMIFLIAYKKGKIVSINSFPKMIQNDLEYDHFIDLTAIYFEEIDLKNKNVSPKVLMFPTSWQSCLSDDFQHLFNVMVREEK